MLDPISLASAGMGLAEKFITGESQEDRLDKELQMKTVREQAKTRRALIRKSTGRLRIFALAVLTAPFLAPVFPWVSVADVQAYFQDAISAVPTWWTASLQAAFAAIWAGGEARNLNANRDERRLAEKETEQSPEPESERDTDPHTSPKQRGGR